MPQFKLIPVSKIDCRKRWVHSWINLTFNELVAWLISCLINWLFIYRIDSWQEFIFLHIPITYLLLSEILSMKIMASNLDLEVITANADALFSMAPKHPQQNMWPRFNGSGHRHQSNFHTSRVDPYSVIVWWEYQSFPCKNASNVSMGNAACPSFIRSHLRWNVALWYSIQLKWWMKVFVYWLTHWPCEIQLYLELIIFKLLYQV